MTRSAKLARAINRHKGQWVVVDTAGKTVVGYGKTLGQAESMAHKHNPTKPIAAKVPTEKIDTFFF